MLKAEKSKWFESVFSLYNSNLLRRRFDSLRVSGLESLKPGKDLSPTVICCNHSSWWDGLVAFEISRRLSLDSFLMMEERQLRRYWLFRKLGAFSVTREDPRSAYASVVYAAELLNSNRRRSVWIFPQGEITSNYKRPLSFYSGASKILEKTGKCRTVCVCMRYEFLGEYKPSIFVKVGDPSDRMVKGPADRKLMISDLEEELCALLDELHNEIIDHRFDGYIDLI